MSKNTRKAETLDEIYKAVRMGIEECLSDRRGLSMHNAGNVLVGSAFTEFYVRNIAFYIDNLSDEDTIRNGLECDGSKDLGIDFIYEKEDDTFWIYQSKYKGGKNATLTRDEIAGFFAIHNRILDPNMLAGANNTVQELLTGFTRKSSATYVLLTNAKASEENAKEFERMKREIQEKLQAESPKTAENYDWQLIDLSEIKSNFKQARSVEDKPPSVKIPIASFGQHGYIDISKEIAQQSGKEYKTIIMVIRGTTLSDLCQQHRTSLFNYNIRGFLGAKKTKNKKITETLSKEPHFFYLYNNGISAMCRKLEIIKDGKNCWAECDAFQIINGAQTVCSIRDFGKKPENAKNLRKVCVLMRITQAEPTKSIKGLNKNIITFNNTQNVIRDADFRSNDQVQASLEKAFKTGNFQYRVSTPYKTLVYRPKRMFYPRDNSVVPIDMDNMAKSLYAFMFNEPEKLNSQTSFLFDESDKGSYWQVFGDNGEETTSVFPHIVKKFAAIAALNYFLATELKPMEKTYSKDTVRGMVVRTRRHILWAFGFVVREFYPGEESAIYNKILDGKAFGEKKFVRDWLDTIILTIEMELEREGQNGKTLNFKAWQRDRKKTEALIRTLRKIIELRYKDGVPKI